MYKPEGLSARAVAKILNVSPNNVRDVLKSKGVDLSLGKHFISNKAVGRTSPMKGKVRSQESILKQVSTRKENGKPARSGYKHSEETLRKISAATKGKNVRYTDEEKAQLQKCRSACKRMLRRVLQFKGTTKCASTVSYLGYDRVILSQHLGVIKEGFEIDHVVPVVEFFRRGITDPSIINALPNLRVISREENRKKSDALPPNCEELIQICIQQGSK